MNTKTTISGIITALSGFLTLIALAPPELQNQIPQVFPEAYRGFIALVLGFIAVAAHTYKSKNTQDASDSSTPEKDSRSGLLPLVAVLLCGAFMLGCANYKDKLDRGLASVQAFLAKPTTQAAVRTIIADAAPLVQQYAETGHISNAQGIALGFNSISALAPTVTSNAALQKLIVNTVVQFSGDPKAEHLGQDLAAIVIKSLPPAANPQQVTNAVVAAGIGASNGAQAATLPAP